MDKSTRAGQEQGLDTKYKGADKSRGKGEGSKAGEVTWTKGLERSRSRRDQSKEEELGEREWRREESREIGSPLRTGELEQGELEREWARENTQVAGKHTSAHKTHRLTSSGAARQKPPQGREGSQPQRRDNHLRALHTGRQLQSWHLHCWEICA